MNKYKDLCFDCGSKRYPEKRKDALNGIGVSLGVCPECGKEGGIIPARDWSYRAGEFEKVI